MLNENNSFISCTFRVVPHAWHNSERLLEGSGEWGMLLAETQRVCKLFMQKWSGTGLGFELCMLLFYQIHSTHTHILGVIISYLHTAGYTAQTEGRVIWCIQEKKECLHQKCAYLLINSTDFRYTFKSWSYVHGEQKRFSTPPPLMFHGYPVV